HPKIYLLLSMVIHDNYGISKTVLEQQVLPEEKKIAADTGALLVNYHDAFITHPEYYPDGVHPNDQGTAAIGKFVADALLAPQPPSDGGMESAALDATGGDGATAPLSTGGDAAATPSADASSLQPPPAPEASDSMGQASTGTSSGASAGSNAGSTAGTVAGNATGSMGAASGALHSASSGSSGCAASASRRGRFEGAASGGLALLVLLGTWLRRSKIQRLDD
ncbi:MAG TPA: hypothetical protein VGY54_27845, partial [Polyangiaceae bacterium]|nr:hypothetical protein [Polyangiaceae bacterium]